MGVLTPIPGLHAFWEDNFGGKHETDRLEFGPPTQEAKHMLAWSKPKVETQGAPQQLGRNFACSNCGWEHGSPEGSHL